MLADYRLKLPPKYADKVEIFAFGGYQEAGRNCFGIRSKILKRAWLIDCGRIITRRHEIEDNGGASEEEHLPAFEGIAELWSEIHAVYVTHMHLDHCGGIPQLYVKLGGRHCPPIITAPFTARFIQSLFETGEQQPPYYEMEAGKRLRYDAVEFRPIAVPHSTRQTRSFLFYLPDGHGDTIKLLFVSDFKFADCRLTGGLRREFIQTLGQESSVDILIYEALYKNRAGETDSEDVVAEGLEEMLQLAPKGLVLSFFASNLDRLEMTYERVRRDRMFCYTGRSMCKMIKLAKEAGWLADPEGYQETPTVLLKPMVMVTTGSQAEPYAVLTRLSQGEGPFDVRESCSFGIMADPIPGNEQTMKEMIEGLAKLCSQGYVFVSPRTRRMTRTSGANIRVIEHLHVSGHASAGDHKRLLDLVRPQVAIEYHYPVDFRGDEVIPD